jgi:hypothetical protein
MGSRRMQVISEEEGETLELEDFLVIEGLEVDSQEINPLEGQSVDLAMLLSEKEMKMHD